MTSSTHSSDSFEIPAKKVQFFWTLYVCVCDVVVIIIFYLFLFVEIMRLSCLCSFQQIKILDVLFLQYLFFICTFISLPSKQRHQHKNLSKNLVYSDVVVKKNEQTHKVLLLLRRAVVVVVKKRKNTTKSGVGRSSVNKTNRERPEEAGERKTFTNFQQQTTT